MRVFAILGIAVTLACAGNTEPQRVCTLIGCNDGLNVVVNSALQQDYTVTVTSGGQTLHSFTCRPGQPCQAFVENRTPATVTVALATAMGPISKDFTPEYKISKPNGPDCPPDCKQATVTVTVS
jgi:hypothetical protein